uniref:Putative methyltransferase n=1 Tax=viral metagenome TaxID=1070528 RepID=A0A6M3KYM6_9ZZZZ
MTQVEPYVTVQVPVDKIVVHTRRRLLVSEQVDLLAKSIQDIGLLNPISLTENWTLIAGCHRLRACKQLGWTVIPATICSLSDVDAELAEIDENLMRADLTVLERGQHLSRRKELYEAKNPGTKHGGAPGKAGGGKVAKVDKLSTFASDEKAQGKETKCKTENEKISFSVDTAEKTGESDRTIRRYVFVAEKIDAEVQEIIADLPIADNQSELTKLAKMKPDQQKEVAARLATGQVETVAEVAKEKRVATQQAKIDEIKGRAVDEAPGLYDVIVIDPPWPAQKIPREVRPNQTLLDYPTMTLDEIRALSIPAQEDCQLWLWTTERFLPDAFGLLDAWGFRYVCTFVWHKPGGFQPINLPQYNCEFALYARRGSSLFVDTKNFFTCFNAPRGEHSEKPEQFYEIVRRVTVGRRLDMFNRRPISGFDGWGLEAQ